jgi:hypothetical protein
MVFLEAVKAFLKTTGKGQALLKIDFWRWPDSNTSFIGGFCRVAYIKNRDIAKNRLCSSDMPNNAQISNMFVLFFVVKG